MSEMGLSFKIDTAEATETLRNKILEEHIELPVVLVPALRPVVADYYIEAAFNARKIRSTGTYAGIGKFLCF